MDTIATTSLPADAATPAGDVVLYPNCVLMRAGDYSKQRGIVLSPEDLQRAADEFTPVPNVFHHYKAYLPAVGHKLEGKLGEVRDVWTEDDGRVLKGLVAIPKWLDEVWGNDKTVSTEWDRKTKRVTALGVLIDRPFIKGTALMAAFAAAGGDATDDDAAEDQDGVTDDATDDPPPAGTPDSAFADTSNPVAPGTWKVGAARDLPIVDEDAWDKPAARASLLGPGPGVMPDARKGFLIYNADEPDLRESYKLPFARREKGGIVASRAGLRSAANRLPQTYAPQAVLDRARAVIDGYQAKMARADEAKSKGGGKDKGKVAMAATASDSPPPEDPEPEVAPTTFAAPKQDANVAAFFQRMHDEMAMFHPGLCDPATRAVRFAAGAGPGRGDYTKQQKSLQQMHELTVGGGATCPGRAATMSASPDVDTMPARRTPRASKGATRMDWDERLAAFMGIDPDKLPWKNSKKSRAILTVAMADDDEITVEDEPEPETVATPETPAPAPKPEDLAAAFAASQQYRDMQAQNTAMEAEVKRLKDQAAEHERRENERRESELKARAATFAATLAKGDPARKVPPRITPAAIPAVAAVLEQAARDDATAEAVVTFAASDGKEFKGGRVAVLEAMFAALPGHDLLGQRLAPDGKLDPAQHSILFHDAGDGEDLEDWARKTNDLYLGNGNGAVRK